MSIIRKIGVLVSIFFLPLAAAFAQEGEYAGTPDYPELAAARWQLGRYSFTVSPLLGFLHGQARSLVFRDGGNQYLSELLWDLKPLFYVGLAVEFGPRDPFQRHGFIGATSIKFGIPRRSGTHENRDWLNPNADWLTHYSRHDLYSRRAILLDASAGYSWPLTDFLALSAFMEFSFMHFFWSGRGGFVQYPDDSLYLNFPPWSSDLPKVYLSGEVIRKTQNWFVFAPGFSLTWRINELFSLRGNFSYTPLIFCYARDDHLLRSKTFWDYLFFGHYINGGAAFIFSPPNTNNLDISLSLSYRRISGTRGTTREVYHENVGTIPAGRTRTFIDSAGAAFSAMDISLAARIRLFGQN